MTEMQAALTEQSDHVLRNVSLGLTNDQAKEEAIALFRLAAAATPLTLTDLDTLRADAMRALLDETGQGQIWKYDITTRQQALREALDVQNYDNIQHGFDARVAGKPYALIGPGIDDHHFATPLELVKILEWLCLDGGYLSCYARFQAATC